MTLREYFSTRSLVATRSLTKYCLMALQFCIFAYYLRICRRSLILTRGSYYKDFVFQFFLYTL